MATGPAFVVNRAGAVHSVPGEWVMVDPESAAKDAVTIRGNKGYRLATAEEITEWHDSQGLDSRTDEDSDTDENDFAAQPSNFTVEDADGLAVEDPVDTPKSSAKGK